MSIRCVCPNGHVLKVKDALAGTSGLCPKCRARVNVPRPRPQPVSEDAILDILGRQSRSRRPTRPRITTCRTRLRFRAIHERGTPKKSCNKCNEEISAGTHICPYCHTYIAKLDDF